MTVTTLVPVRKTVVVKATQEHAFEVFGDRAGTTRAALDGDGGWSGILQELVRLVG